MSALPPGDRYDKAKSLLRLMRKMSKTFGQDTIAIETEFYLKEEEQAANLAVELHRTEAQVQAVNYNEEGNKWTVRSIAYNLNLHSRDTMSWLEKMLQLAETYNCSLKSSSPDFDIQLF